MIVSVDFDGTCVTHEFPNTGKNIGAEIVLKQLQENNIDIICVSMRSEEQKDSFGINTIKGIKNWFEKENIKLLDINRNPNQDKWSKSRKIYANYYIDDQFIGCPLKFDEEYSDRPFVNWYKVAIILSNMGLILDKQIKPLLEELSSKYSQLYSKYRYGNITLN